MKLIKLNISLFKISNKIRNIMFNYFNRNNNKIILGRWEIEKESYKTNIKIDNANEDHCGTCLYTKK